MNFNLFDHSYPIRTSRDSTNEIYRQKPTERKWRQIVQIVVFVYKPKARFPLVLAITRPCLAYVYVLVQTIFDRGGKLNIW